MKKSPMFLTVLTVVVVVCMVSCNGDTCSCECCAGNSCTLTLQGYITVSSCDSSSCMSACKNKYPQQCVDGSGISRYQCRSDTISAANWAGVFKMGNKCDQRTCCCPVGQLTLSRVDTNNLRVRCSLAGQVCPPGISSLDDMIAIPIGRDTQVTVMGNVIRVTLSQDDRVIQLNNPAFPACSESAERNEAPPVAANWVGVFNMANKCDQRTCCCPVGQLTVSRVGTSNLGVQCSLAGQVCPPGISSLDGTIAIPIGRDTQITVMGNVIRVTLSQDDRVIQLNNPAFPACTESAERSEALSTAQINITLMSLLFGLMSVKQFII